MQTAAVVEVAPAELSNTPNLDSEEIYASEIFEDLITEIVDETGHF